VSAAASTPAGAHPLQLFLRANRRALAELLLGSLMINVFVLALPLFSMLVYDKAVGNEIHETLWALTIGVALLLALELCLRIARTFMIEHAGARWDAHLDERLLRGVLAAPLSKALQVGEVLARYRDLAVTRDVLSTQFLLPLADVPFVLLFAVVLVAISGPLVAVPLLMAALLFGVSHALQARARGYQKTANAAHGRKIAWLADVLLTRESLADPRAAAVAQSGMRQPALHGARAASRGRLWSQLSQQVVPVGLSLTSVLTLVFGVFLIESQALSVGGLISSSMLSSRMVASLCGLVPVLSRWTEFKRALLALRSEINLDTPPAAAGPGASQTGAPRTPTAGAFATEGVRLEGVRFEYAERPILNDISCALKAGELIAVVGASGAGKSTLLRLLAGQLPASAGQMVFAANLIDCDAARHWLGAQVTYKPQDPVFLGGTVREVVAPGQPDADDAAIVAALRGAGLGPALDKGELGLTSPVGTNGAGVSGGQRQMLALARVLASDRPLLVLDEPTLGLDRSAQEHLLRALPALRDQGRCVIVATHTTELIQCADRVLVLDGGRIVADALPAQLMEASATAPRRRA
jgi:ABC-type bacteriocin/lantibiotic exporter with double-glycine peptidase domain